MQCNIILTNLFCPRPLSGIFSLAGVTRVVHGFYRFLTPKMLKL